MKSKTGGWWPSDQAPATITYASVVSCETLRLALTFASLNDLKVNSLSAKSVLAGEKLVATYSISM